MTGQQTPKQLRRERMQRLEERAEEAEARLETATRISQIAVRDANFTHAVNAAVFNVCGAAEQLLEARMPRGASYLLSALQTIQSEYEEMKAQRAWGSAPVRSERSEP